MRKFFRYFFGRKTLFLFSSFSHTSTVVLLTSHLVFCSPSFSQRRQIDSLRSLLKTDKEDTNKVKHLAFLGLELSNSNPDTSILINRQALQLAEKLNWKKGIASSLGQLGSFYRFKGDHSKALDYYFKALKMAKELGDKFGIAADLGNIGTVYKQQADYPKALDYYFKALKMKEELEDKKGIATVLTNIGIVYVEQADYPKALDYYFKALKMATESGYKNAIATNLCNIGIVYNDQADYSKAFDYYFKALKMAEELGNKNLMAGNLSNIGTVYSNQADSAYSKGNKTFALADRYPKALDYYFKALKIDEELGHKNGIAIHLCNIGLLYTKIRNFAKAEKYLNHSLALYDSINALDGIRDVEKFLSELYDTTGRVKLALVHYKKYIAARDSVTNDEQNKKQMRSEMNYDFEKKELAAKAEQDKKDAIAKEELKQKEQQRNYFIAGFALVGILAVFILRSLLQNRKKNKIISVQKAQVDKAYESLHEKNKEVMDSIRYAKRIQTALITSEKYFTRKLNELNKN